tara:strand:+ start:9411 stop:11243 length:1833 start_codon:yes stop_codon:yes gene_type:complete
MAKAAAVQIPVRLEKDKAEKDAKQLTASLIGGLKPTVDVANLAAAAFSALGSAISAATAFAGESIQLAFQQERAERGLLAALKIRGAATGEVFERTQKFNREIQNALGIGDERLLQMQKTLLAMNVHEAQLNLATKATIGLSAATGQDLTMAARTAARAMNGEVSALTRYGIKATDAADATRKLVDLFSIAEGEAASMEGRVNALAAAWGDMQEKIAGLATQSEGGKRALESLTRLVESFGTWVVASGDPVVNFFDRMATAVRFTIDPLNTARDALEDYAKQIEKTQPFAAAALRHSLAGTMFETPSAAAPGGGIVEFAGEGSVVEVPRGKPPRGKPRRDPLATDDPLDVAYGRASTALMRQMADDQRALLAEQQELDDILLAAKREVAATERQIDEERLASKAAFSAGLREWEAAELDATGAFYGQLAAIAGAGISSLVSTTVSGLIQGNLTIEKALGALFGTLLSGVGQSMVALGSAALAAASATSVIPILWPIFGGPIGIGGAIGLITAGSALVGVGQSMGSLAAGASSEIKSTAAAGVARYGGAAAPPRGGVVFGGPTAPPTNLREAVPPRVVNVSFNNALPGSERRMAREIKRILNAGDLGLAAG